MRGHWVGALALAAVVLGRPSWAQGPQHPKQFSGVAAYYHKGYKGKTARGEHYDPEKFTAAHKTLPLGTRLRITDKRTGRSVDVEVNDRGPFTRGRVLDLSLAAAKQLGVIDRGLTYVTADIQ
jgi:rare lipoprotein A